MWNALNIALFVFHTALILFNIFGWMWRGTRRWNLLTLGLTIFSWVVMGFWKGAGYCICTDWHWQVRSDMGIVETADSYIILLARTMFGWDPSVATANSIALWFLVASLIGSLVTNMRDLRRDRAMAAAEAPTEI